MNATEKNYACKRIDELANEFHHKVYELYRDTAPTDDELVNLAAKGELKISPLGVNTTTIRYRYAGAIRDVCDLSQWTKDQSEFRKTVQKEIAAKAQAAKDEIMLGDAEKAKRLITEFRAMRVMTAPEK